MSIVPIIMGSKSDLAHGEAIAKSLSAFGIKSEIRVASAHKAASYLLGILEKYEANAEPTVYITIAGRSNALSGMIDAHVNRPVIACPPYSDSFGGADIYSSLRMPSGVAPAVVLDPKGAALLATKILSLADDSLREKIAQAQKDATQKIIDDDSALNS
ncbi:MAG: AIR carboxylase family protein [Chloroflexota bacterium]